MSGIGPGISPSRRSVPAQRGQQAYARLRRAIILGEIRPNERLVESELAEVMKVSRTPIREGLQRLAAEGLIKSVRRGWVVRELDPEEIREIYEIREALEGFAARLAAAKATDAQLRKLERMVELRAGTPPADKSQLVLSNDLFHSTIFKAAGNTRLQHEILRASEYYFNLKVATLYTEEEKAATAVQHIEMVRALRNRDGDEAERISRMHIREALTAILRHIG